jgi:hypothetical protein
VSSRHQPFGLRAPFRIRISAFGLLSDFGFRISGFGTTRDYCNKLDQGVSKIPHFRPTDSALTIRKALIEATLGHQGSGEPTRAGGFER